MKKYLLIVLCLYLLANKKAFGQNDTCEVCIEYTLEIYGNKLQGSSLQFPGYDVSMNLPSNFSKDSLSLKYLFSWIRNQDVRGEFIFRNGNTTEIQYSLIPYRDTVTIFMKTINGWYPWDKIRIDNNILIFSYDYWYCPPASKIDLEILDLCFSYFRDSTCWHQNDDRLCDDDKINKTWSLFCAIQNASIERIGEYNHRGTVIQTARFVINELYPNREYGHPIMHFNNDSTTHFSDIINVLTIVKERIETELKTKNK